MSLKQVTVDSVDAYSKMPRAEWVMNFPGQIILAASVVHWTTEVTEV